jgi:hypothetical protein
VNVRPTLAALALAAALAQAGFATSASDAPSNLRLYVVTPQAVDIAIDGAPPTNVPAMSVQFFHAPPGMHHLTAQIEGGSAIAGDLDLEPAQMIQSRGRSWWCAVLGERKGSDVFSIFPMDAAGCQRIADDAPATDVPAGR